MTLHFASAAVVLTRAMQFTLAGLAVIFVLGALWGGMNLLLFTAITVLALVLLGTVGVMELLVVTPLRRYGG